MFATLVDLVLPRCCLGCGRAGSPLCPACTAIDVHAVPGPNVAVSAAAHYDGAVRTALIAYKERGRRDLAGPLAALLALAVAALAPRDVTLVPVPSAAAARRARGGDHVARLGRALGGCTSALRFVRAVQDSAGLDSAARASNLSAAMRASPPHPRRSTAVIIDDITTTGATLAEAARALGAAGWTIAGGAVVAATPRRFPSHSMGTQFTLPMHLAPPYGRGLT